MMKTRLICLLAGLLCLGCFDLTAPVEERLRLTFLADDSLRAELSIELHHPESKRSDSNLGRRLRQLEQDLLVGWDPWAKRFGEAGAAIESFYWEKEEGRLTHLERNVILDDPVGLTDLLADSPVQATYLIEGSVAELAFFPGSATGATRRELREIEQTLDAWGELLGDYLHAAEALYRYLDIQPGRAGTCFAHLFESGSDIVYGELTPEEELLLDELSEASGELLEVLDVDAERATSLDELSRKVYDPFPARFEIELPTRALEVEGFLAAGEGWSIPRFSLWSALERVVDTWLTPDPVTAWVTHLRTSPEGEFDIAAFAARERSAISAEEPEILDALLDALTPEDVYRVTWRIGKR